MCVFYMCARVCMPRSLYSKHWPPPPTPTAVCEHVLCAHLKADVITWNYTRSYPPAPVVTMAMSLVNLFLFYVAQHFITHHYVSLNTYILMLKEGWRRMNVCISVKKEAPEKDLWCFFRLTVIIQTSAPHCDPFFFLCEMQNTIKRVEIKGKHDIRMDAK